MKKLALIVVAVVVSIVSQAQQNFSSNFQFVNPGQIVSFIPDNHKTITTGYEWSVEPASGWSYTSGTNSNSTYPVVNFTTPGRYTITLEYGNKKLKKCHYINVGAVNDLQNLKSEGQWTNGAFQNYTTPCPTATVAENPKKYDFFHCLSSFEEFQNDESVLPESSSTLCNINGNILCYSTAHKYSYLQCANQCTWSHLGQVFNRHHNLMLNGNNLRLDAFPGRGRLTLTMPGSNNRDKVYLFSLGSDQQCPSSPPGPTLKAYYHIIDMDGDHGLGEVISKNNVFDVGPLVETISAVPMSNNAGYWIITHSISAAQFKVYSFTATGFNPTPVHITNIGVINTPSGPYGNTYNGQFRVSPDGSKLVYEHTFANRTGPYSSWTYDKYIEVFDFDDATGAITNANTIAFAPVPWTASSTRSVEFSPNSLYAYVGQSRFEEIYVVDLSNPTTYSTVTISPTPVTEITSLELTPDGEIWIDGGDAGYIATIANPNAGTGITVNTSGKYYGSNNLWTGMLNNGTLVRSLIRQEQLLSVTPSDRQKYICPSGTTSLSVTPTIPLTNKQWYSVVDGVISGATGNSLTGLTEGGMYYFQGIDANSNKVKSYFFVRDYSCYNFGLEEEYLTCPGENLDITAQIENCDAKTHRWYDATNSTLLLQGVPSATQTINLGPGEYYLEVETFSGCFLRFDFEIIEETSPELNQVYSAQCGLSVTMDPGDFATYQWFKIENGVEVLIPGATSRTYETFEGGEYLVRVTTHELGCIIDATTRAVIFDCCPITNTVTNEYQASFNNHDHPEESNDWGEPLGTFRSPTTDNSHILQKFEDNGIFTFGLTEINPIGNIMSTMRYNPSVNFEPTDFVESNDPSNSTGKIVIGHEGSSLYVTEVLSSGASHSTHKKAITCAAWSGTSVEAASVVQSYYTRYTPYGNLPYGYAVLVNSTDISTGFCRMYLVGIPYNFSNCWIKEIKSVVGETQPSVHGHKLIEIEENTTGATKSIIVMGSKYTGGVLKGLIVNTNFMANGSAYGSLTPQCREGFNIYYSGVMMRNSVGNDALVFVGSDNPGEFGAFANAAFLRTSPDLTVTYQETTLANYRMRGLDVVQTGDFLQSHAVALLQSSEIDEYTQENQNYFYYLVELDANLDIVASQIKQAINYVNLENELKPEVSSKKLLNNTSENGYIFIGQDGEYGATVGREYFLCKTGPDLSVRCQNQFSQYTLPALDVTTETGDVDPHTPLYGQFDVIDIARNTDKVCCTNNNGQEFDVCEIFHTQQIEFAFTPANGTQIFGTGVDFQFINVNGFDENYIDQYIWNFGDGTETSTTSQTISHTFPFPGVNSSESYQVKLSVRFTNGCEKKIQQTITITCEDGDDFFFTQGTPSQGTISLDLFNIPTSYESFVIDYGDGTTVAGTSANSNYTHQYTCIPDYSNIDPYKHCHWIVCITFYFSNGCYTQQCENYSYYQVQAPVQDEMKDGRTPDRFSDDRHAIAPDGSSVKISSLSISLYPNPTSRTFVIKNSQDIDVYKSVEIYNQTGKIVQNLKHVPSSEHYDLGGEATGVYYVRVNVKNYVMVKKIVYLDR